MLELECARDGISGGRHRRLRRWRRLHPIPYDIGLSLARRGAFYAIRIGFGRFDFSGSRKADDTVGLRS